MARKVKRTEAERERVQRVQDLRRSGAAGSDRNRKRYRRADHRDAPIYDRTAW